MESRNLTELNWCRSRLNFELEGLKSSQTVPALSQLPLAPIGKCFRNPIAAQPHCGPTPAGYLERFPSHPNPNPTVLLAGYTLPSVRVHARHLHVCLPPLPPEPWSPVASSAIVCHRLPLSAIAHRLSSSAPSATA